MLNLAPFSAPALHCSRNTCHTNRYMPSLLQSTPQSAKPAQGHVAATQCMYPAAARLSHHSCTQQRIQLISNGQQPILQNDRPPLWQL